MPAPNTLEATAARAAPPVEVREDAARTKVAYIMSRFPKLTETFVLNEILHIERMGVSVEIFPLQREKTRMMHPDAERLVERAHFHPLLSWPMLCSHLHYLRHKPAAYVAALWALLCATFGSFRYFTGGIVFFPKFVHFARLMQRENVTHIHAHFASHPAAAAFVVHRLTGIPYSFTAHGSDLHRDRRMLREKVAEADFVVAISDYNRRMILEECDDQAAGKVKVVHCGIDVNYFTPSESELAVRHSSNAALRILCVGTLHEVKGQAHLIEACRRLKERGLEFRCRFIGSGPDRHRLEEQTAAAGLESDVEFLGPRTHDEVARLLCEADVVAAPSVPTSDGRREGIPVALMEAMAAGVPVVASRLSGIPELVRHDQTGLLISPRDTEALADALERLAREPDLRHQLAAEARRFVESDFNLASNAAELAALFEHGESP